MWCLKEAENFLNVFTNGFPRYDERIHKVILLSYVETETINVCYSQIILVWFKNIVYLTLNKNPGIKFFLFRTLNMCYTVFIISSIGIKF